MRSPEGALKLLSAQGQRDIYKEPELIALVEKVLDLLDALLDRYSLLPSVLADYQRQHQRQHQHQHQVMTIGSAASITTGI